MSSVTHFVWVEPHMAYIRGGYKIRVCATQPLMDSQNGISRLWRVTVTSCVSCHHRWVWNDWLAQKRSRRFQESPLLTSGVFIVFDCFLKHRNWIVELFSSSSDSLRFDIKISWVFISHWLWLALICSPCLGRLPQRVVSNAVKIDDSLKRRLQSVRGDFKQVHSNFYKTVWIQLTRRCEL